MNVIQMAGFKHMLEGFHCSVVLNTLEDAEVLVAQNDDGRRETEVSADTS